MSKPRPPALLDARIRAEATEWLIRFSEGDVDAGAREDFNNWLRTSSEHVRAYLRISAFWQDADRVEDKQIAPDIEALVQLAQQDDNVVSLGLETPERSIASPRKAASTKWGIAAAILLAVGLAVAGWHTLHRYPTYSTDTGEQRTVNLPDGSSVVINARSSIRVKYTEAERIIELREGQALFRVARNPARPFTVRSGDAHIRAVGTQFDVYRKESGTTVTVIEGRVAIRASTASAAALPRVDSARAEESTTPRTGTAAQLPKRTELLLSAGEQLIVSPSVLMLPTAANVDNAMAWTTGLLVFDSAPLKDVVREFNRQNAKPLVLSGADLADLRISGTFPSSGSERIVRFLQERFHVVVDETDDEIRIGRGALEP
jgi:transmembrane sensor